MKKVAICVDLNEQCFKTLKKLKNSELFKNAEIHLVHFFEIQVYTAEFTPFVFPTTDQYPDIEKSTIQSLANLENDLGITAKKVCKFVHSSEESVHEYLKEQNINLVVVSTQGKHGIEGFFHSSFTDYLVKYSPCDVFVVRPKSE